MKGNDESLSQNLNKSFVFLLFQNQETSLRYFIYLIQHQQLEIIDSLQRLSHYVRDSCTKGSILIKSFQGFIAEKNEES